MKIFNWVQDKLYGKHEKKTLSFGHDTLASNPHKEEFDDWPQTLLAIGTLGENKMKEEGSRNEPSKIPQASQNLPDFTSEVVKLQKELTELLSQKRETSTDESEGGQERRANPPLDRHLNCMSPLDAGQTTSKNISNSLGTDDDTDLSSDAKTILMKAKDFMADKKSGIRKKSLKFLLKKILVCHSGFVPTPSLKDPLPESRMEKILRAMLHKKIYPHSWVQPTTKKYMDRQPSVKKCLENESRFQVEERKEKGEKSNKWVKTDSEYIVLEI